MQLIDMPEKNNYDEVAIALWQTFEALTEQGFTVDQALVLVVAMIKGQS